LLLTRHIVQTEPEHAGHTVSETHYSC